MECYQDLRWHSYPPWPLRTSRTTGKVKCLKPPRYPKMVNGHKEIAVNIRGHRRVSSDPGGRSFREMYNVLKKIGQGANASVWLCEHRFTGVLYAVKILENLNEKPKNHSVVTTYKEELDIHKSLATSQHIVKLFEAYHEGDRLLIVMEYMEGGTLTDHLMKKRTGYTEDKARSVIYDLLCAIKSLHDRNIVHRDIKLDNILVAKDGSVKVCDFGFSQVRKKGEGLLGRCGTPTYMAPEVVQRFPCDESSDMWSIGVCSYLLMGGYPPYYTSTRSMKRLFHKIVYTQFKFHDHEWEAISSSAKDFISSLLIKNPRKRLTVNEALEHPWITGHNNFADTNTNRPPLNRYSLCLQGGDTIRKKKNKNASVAVTEHPLGVLC